MPSTLVLEEVKKLLGDRLNPAAQNTKVQASRASETICSQIQRNFQNVDVMQQHQISFPLMRRLLYAVGGTVFA